MKKGEYVVATVWSDGHCADPWYVGYYHSSPMRGLHYIEDGAGNLFHRGFHKVRKITEEQGRWLLENADDIEKSGRSVWWFLKNYEEINEKSRKSTEKTQTA